MRKMLTCLVLLHVSGWMWAFSPPRDEKDGVTATIQGVPETHLLPGPLPFTVSVSNTSAQPRAGQVRVWLNDDWQIIGSDTRSIDVPAGAEVVLSFEARPLDRALRAHYPVHALVRLEGGAGPVDLHPIAIFVTERAEQAADVREPGIPGGLYECLSTGSAITIDGDLAEWDHAVPAGCGPDQHSSGTVDPTSFDGVFYALHDETTLYLAFRAVDDQVDCRDQTTPDFMNSDYIRLYLSAIDPDGRGDAALSRDDLVLAISVLGKGDRPAVRVPPYAAGTPPGFRLENCSFAARRNQSGYTFEAAIPLSSVGSGLGTGSILGANVLVGDADDGRRVAEMCLGRFLPDYWLSPRAYFRLALSERTEPSTEVIDTPPLIRLGYGVHRLDQIRGRRHALQVGDIVQRFPPGWNGMDQDTGATWRPGMATRGGIQRNVYAIHPPYRGGTGGIWCDFNLSLPQTTPITLDVSTAIRDHNPETEPPSDGVEFRIVALQTDGTERRLFERFSDAKTWQAASVDLSEFAGSTLRLRLWSGPGPAGNTTCDSGYWGDPVIVVGAHPQPPSPDDWQRREDAAIYAAASAAAGRVSDGAFALSGPLGPFGAAIVLGQSGLPDAVLAFSDGKKTLTYHGFCLEIDGLDCADWRSGVRVSAVDSRASGNQLRVTHHIETPSGTLLARVDIGRRQGALSVAFSMPGTERDVRGTPRFTRLGLGPSSAPIRRAYLGFGNVVEGIEAPFTVSGGGFGLSTRHVGADYTNGVSLLQATDIYPDRVTCDPETHLFRIETPHDATFLFIPATGGAFAAARHYRDLNGFKPGKGVRKLLGRMCLDQWGGDYLEAAADLKRAADYGLNHSIFVKHAWQRWGYDYRLPEIYPPAGGLEPFKAMADTCRANGMLFAPHDNYIDYYPDAEGFSYDHIIFNADGTPQRAWLNEGRQAQSYRWLPHGFSPWLKRNMTSMRNGFAPTGLFIDVFSAIPMLGYYDRGGRYYTRERTTKEWRAAFDTSRRILGRGAPMLSEAGHDALIGSLDGAQSDHLSADRWGIRARAATRTPWHDMATHGRFVLLAGGLGSRYGDGDAMHTYGTDDYLSNTVIGGRNPMSDGPFNRRAVMTYWLLHDVCDSLARAEFESHVFVDDSVYRQRTVFSDGGKVWTNRGPDAWALGDTVLPEYGFWVETPAGRAGVFTVEGQRVGFAESDSALFADARPMFMQGSRRRLSTKVLNGAYVGDGRFEVTVEWDVLEPLAEGTVVFVHIVHPRTEGQGEKIAHHGSMTTAPEAFSRVGRFTSTITAQIPADSFGGEYLLRYGLYNPKQGGARILPAGDLDGSRVRGGRLTVDIAGGVIRSGRYDVENAAEFMGELNVGKRMLPIGPFVTNGAFRLLRPKDEAWTLIPLPGSMPFDARLDLVKLGAPGAVVAIDVVEPYQAVGTPPTIRETDRTLDVSFSADAFAYRIRFR